MAEYEIREDEDKDGNPIFHYVLKADNGEVVETSETFPTRQHAERGVLDAEKAAAEADPPEAA